MFGSCSDVEGSLLAFNLRIPPDDLDLCTVMGGDEMVLIVPIGAAISNITTKHSSD